VASNQPQNSQISWITALSTVKNALPCITRRFVEVNCSGHSSLIPLSRCAFIRSPGTFPGVDENFGAVTQSKTP
jgi:hypothetical protein